jgi:hypothetical protein
LVPWKRAVMDGIGSISVASFDLGRKGERRTTALTRLKLFRAARLWQDVDYALRVGRDILRALGKREREFQIHHLGPAFGLDAREPVVCGIRSIALVEWQASLRLVFPDLFRTAGVVVEAVVQGLELGVHLVHEGRRKVFVPALPCFSEDVNVGVFTPEDLDEHDECGPVRVREGEFSASGIC